MQGKRIQDVAFRMHVAQPKPRDRQGRPPVIPAGLEAARSRKDAGEKKRSEKDVEVKICHSPKHARVLMTARIPVCFSPASQSA